MSNKIENPTSSDPPKDFSPQEEAKEALRLMDLAKSALGKLPEVQSALQLRGLSPEQYFDINRNQLDISVYSGKKGSDFFDDNISIAGEYGRNDIGYKAYSAPDFTREALDLVVSRGEEKFVWIEIEIDRDRTTGEITDGKFFQSKVIDPNASALAGWTGNTKSMSSAIEESLRNFNPQVKASA